MYISAKTVCKGVISMKEMYFNIYPHLDKLHIGIKRMMPGEQLNMNFHLHKFSEIAIVLKADANSAHWAEGRNSHIRRGDILLLHPGKVHAYENTAGVSLVNLLYYADQLPLPTLDAAELQLFRHFTDPALNLYSPEKPVCHLEEKELLEVEKLTKDLEKELISGKPGSRLCAFGLFIAILVYIFRPGGESCIAQNYEATASTALNYLNNNCTENINIGELAKMCSLSQRSFFRKFRELTGYSPGEYQLMKKLELAEHLLVTTRMPLKQIAHSCGFCDSNYLNKMFAKRYGSAPGAFRRKNQIRSV